MMYGAAVLNYNEFRTKLISQQVICHQVHSTQFIELLVLPWVPAD